MYCANCGVKLADSETRCPLCQTRAFHPDLPLPGGEGLYPQDKYPAKASRRWLLIPLTVLLVLPVPLVLLGDLQTTGSISWSGYVIGALVLFYVSCILPLWFKKPNPVIFVPSTFATVGVYLLYINYAVGGNWFLSFAFPVVGSLGLIATAVTALMRYVPRGALYTFGGAFIALGGFNLLLEYLLVLTFPAYRFLGWSFYPLIALSTLGGLLIFLGICRPAREAMERKFFI